MIKMNKKFLVLFIIILLGLTVLSAFTLENDDYLELNKTTLNISAGGYPVDYFVESLNKEEYYMTKKPSYG